MSIFKNDIPILEFDNENDSVIAALHEHESLHLPERAVFAFLGEAVDRYAKAHGAVIVDHYETISKLYPIYVLEKDGQQICLVEAPVGAPAATVILDALIACGVRKIISGGSCGVLVPMEENVFLIPEKALRDEGTSNHYLPPERFVGVSETARNAIEQTLQSHHLPCSAVVTWTTDGFFRFFRETRDMVEDRKSEGCSVVEMECAALAACAQFRGAAWGELLFTADTLANAERYDARDWGRDSVDLALELCMEAVCRM